VLYGGNNNWFAAYAYWYFKLYGHSDVKLLDGGHKKWELDRRKPRQRGSAAEADVLHHAGAGPLDPRLSATRPSTRSGRRTWSTSARPTSSRAVEQGRDRGRHIQVRRRAAQALLEQGLDSSRLTILSCRIGERSSHTWFALHGLLGETT